jgi:hypothetical protein
MPIMQPKPLAPPDKQSNYPKIQPPRANTVVVDNSKTPLASLITHVAGMALINDYYRLVVNKDNVLYAQDVGQSGVEQQYIKYRNFEIRQQGSFTEDQNTEDKVFLTRGTGIVHSGFIPNEGDMFVADVGDGRRAVFNITRSERMSNRVNAVYQIDYAMAYFVGDKPSEFDDLEGKVIQTYFYVKERLGMGLSPFLSDEEYSFSRNLMEHFQEMCGLYQSWFFSKEFAAYIVPGQNMSTFDYFLYKAQRTIFQDDVFGVLKKHQSMNITDDDLIERKLDLFSVLIERSATKFKICDRRVGFCRTETFHFDGVTTNIRYTGIKALVYPYSTEKRNDEGYNSSGKSFSLEPMVPTPNTLDPEILADEVTAYNFGGKTVPLVKLVSEDDYYVFTESFYKRGEDISVLEAQVLAYIDGKEINPTALRILLQNYIYWPRLERFYYMPVLMILILATLRGV